MEIAALFLGWLLGGLVNVLSDSLPRLRGLRRPFCVRCGAPRPAVAWLGIVGWIAGKRRCAHCHHPQSWRWPLVEAWMGLSALALATLQPIPSGFWVGLFVLSAFTLITVIDLEHRLILHMVSLPTALVLALIGGLDPARGWSKTLLGGAAGFGAFLALYFLGQLFGRWLGGRRGEAVDEEPFGFGDVMLAGVIGLLVGWPGVWLALFAGIMLAGVFSAVFIFSRMIRGRYTPFTPIPYGPFMVLGALMVYFGVPLLAARLAAGA